MATISFIAMCCALSLGAIYSAAQDCSKIPVFKISNCCKFPELVSSVVVADLALQVDKLSGSDDFKYYKLNELIFKKLNLIKNNDIDVTATLKFLDKQVKDPNWKPIIQKNFVACNKNMAPNVDSYQKQFNITKAQCNLKYASVVLCMDVLGLQACPDSSYTSGKPECDAAKAFATECDLDMKAMDKFLSN